MTLSVIIPVYNGEIELPRLLTSVADQTDTDGVEWIFVDDGSTDTSLAILNAFAAGHGSVRVLHKDNGGVSSARNAGLDVATGRFLFFADADDALLPTAVANITDTISTWDGTPMIWTFAYDEVRDRRERRITNGANPTGCPTEEPSDEVLNRILMHRFNGEPWAKVFPRTLVGSIRFDTALTHSEDLLFFLRVMLASQARVQHRPEAVYRYFRRPTSASYRNDFLGNARLLNDRVKTELQSAGVWVDNTERFAAYALTSLFFAMLRGGRLPSETDLAPFLPAYRNITALPPGFRTHLNWIPLYCASRGLGRFYLRYRILRTQLRLALEKRSLKS